MNRDSSNRVPVDLVRAITILTIIVTLVAAFVLASEIVLILFLGVLFGVFLTKLSGLVSARTPAGYRGSLAIVVVSLLLAVAGATTFFFVQINQQVEEASGKIDEGMNELRSLIGKYPVLRTTIATTPFVSDALGIEKNGKATQQNPGEGKEDDSESSEQSGM